MNDTALFCFMDFPDDETSKTWASSYLYVIAKAIQVLRYALIDC